MDSQQLQYLTQEISNAIRDGGLTTEVTLRDIFAAAALSTMDSTRWGKDVDGMAVRAFKIGEAMLKARAIPREELLTQE